jgi:hypothetical protein
MESVMDELLNGADLALSGSVLLVGLFLIILCILWFLLPFAIFGTKDKLDELIYETRKTNEELSALRFEVAGLKDQHDKISPIA